MLQMLDLTHIFRIIYCFLDLAYLINVNNLLIVLNYTTQLIGELCCRVTTLVIILVSLHRKSRFNQKNENKVVFDWTIRNRGSFYQSYVSMHKTRPD